MMESMFFQCPVAAEIQIRPCSQGSILGPFLLIRYYVHNYNNYCNLHMYADDTQFYYSFFPDGAAKMNSYLELVLDKHSLFFSSEPFLQ